MVEQYHPLLFIAGGALLLFLFLCFKLMCYLVHGIQSWPLNKNAKPNMIQPEAQGRRPSDFTF